MFVGRGCLYPDLDNFWSTQTHLFETTNSDNVFVLNLYFQNTTENTSTVGASFLGPSRPSISKPNNLSPSTFKQEVITSSYNHAVTFNYIVLRFNRVLFTRLLAIDRLLLQVYDLTIDSRKWRQIMRSNFKCRRKDLNNDVNTIGRPWTTKGVVIPSADDVNIWRSW